MSIRKPTTVEPRLRASLAKENNAAYKDHGQAISYRFVCDEKGWRVFVSTALPEPKWVTNKQLGALGVDINVDHLAVVETDRFGNPVNSVSIPLPLHGKKQDQTRTIIGDACACIADMAVATRKPIIVEQLDFSKKSKT